MAVPISAQRSVAGILRVGGSPRSPYSRDDLRLLDILGSLASLALDNSLLFNQVQESALRDGLTGLITHKAFQDSLENAVLEASRYNYPLSVILTDVDHFKSINDIHGHQAGDQVLSRIRSRSGSKRPRSRCCGPLWGGRVHYSFVANIT